MTPADLYQTMSLPASAQLGKRVFKKLFVEHATLTAADKRVFSDDLDQVIWQYALKGDTVGLTPYVDDEREYLEIAVLEAQLSSRKSAKRLAEIIHRAIPYPVVLVLSEGEGLALSTAHTHSTSLGAWRTEMPCFGPWLDGTERTSIERAFLDHLALSSLPQTHAFDLYSAIATRLLALVVGQVSGRFDMPDPLTTTDEARLERLVLYQALERGVAGARAELRAETSFARKVELNVHIKALEKRLAALAITL